MIQLIQAGLITSLNAFITANYATATDGLDALTTYIDPEFRDGDLKTYKRLLDKTNFSAVLWDWDCENELEAPHSHEKLRIGGSLTLIRKSANQWDASNRRNRVLHGSAAAPLMNSLSALATNYSVYLRDNRLLSGSTEITYWQDVTNIEKPIIAGDFVSVTCQIDTLGMFSRTLSITPV